MGASIVVPIPSAFSKCLKMIQRVCYVSVWSYRQGCAHTCENDLLILPEVVRISDQGKMRH